MPKRYNWKSRQQVDVIVGRNSAEHLIDLPNGKLNQFDEANPLILPSEKRKTKVIRTQETSKKLLSKKQKKRLEQIVKKREKKDKRAELIESLAQVQAPRELLNKLLSIASVQTQGLRRFGQQKEDKDRHYDHDEEEEFDEEDIPQKKLSLVQTITKKELKRRRALLAHKNAPAPKIGPNYVGFEDYSSDSDENEDNENENLEITLEDRKRKLIELSECPEETSKRQKIEDQEEKIEKEVKTSIPEEENKKEQVKILENKPEIEAIVTVNKIKKKKVIEKKIVKNGTSSTPVVEDNERNKLKKKVIKKKKLQNGESITHKEGNVDENRVKKKKLKNAKMTTSDEKLQNGESITPEEGNVDENRVKKKKLKNAKTTTSDEKKNKLKNKKLQEITPGEGNVDENKVKKKKLKNTKTTSDLKKNKLKKKKLVTTKEVNVEDENKEIVLEKVENIIPETHNVPKTLLRPAEVITSRACLPIIAEEQAIMEAIFENQVVVICGDTGSGKTTQLPQFLFEKGIERCIAVTQPRRVAATAMAKRVAYETGLGCPVVAHSIRYESTANRKSKIIFMTDGVLFKEIQNDPLLRRFSVVVIDEAHERTLYTDVLLGILSRLVPLRFKKGDPLRLVVMSATLRIEDFIENSHLFRTPPPVIKIDARQYDVAVHWSRFTAEDYVEAAFKKVCKIHAQLPAGAILVFLTGQHEIEKLVRRLRITYPYIDPKNPNSNSVDVDKKNEMKKKTENGESSSNDEYQSSDDDSHQEDEILDRVLRSKRHKRTYLMNDQKKKSKNISEKKVHDPLPEINLDAYSAWDVDKYEKDEFLDSLDEEDEKTSDAEDLAMIDLEMAKKSKQPLWVLPLYSLLPSYKQNMVFDPPPEGCRLCVVATNVAETSLTIPGIKYVVDSGRCKQPVWDLRTGASAMQISWASQASAEQRRGRAGRTGPGHCYRLYSSAVYTDAMPKYAIPEVTRRPLEHLVLQVKFLGVPHIENFPFPTPIPKENLKEAENRLILLGAIETFEHKNKKNIQLSKITELGQTMCLLSVSPSYARLLASAASKGRRLAELSICLVASLSANQLLLDDPAEARKSWIGNPNTNSALLGDPLVSLMTLLSAEAHIYQNKNLKDFCQKYSVRMAALKDARLLRRQLTKEVDELVPQLELSIDPEMSGPNENESTLFRKYLLMALPDRIARRNYSSAKAKSYSYLCTEMEQEVLLHGSCLFRGRKNPPEWVVYHELFETKPLPSDGALRPKGKMFIRGVTAIEPQWLPNYVPSLCHLSEPKTDPPPRWDAKLGVVLGTVSGTIGRAAHTLPISEITLPSGSPNRYKWFARFFLEGLVCPPLETFKSSLMNSPSIIIQPWSSLQPSSELFYQALVSKRVDCLKKLEEIWEKDKKYLLQEYLLWLPNHMHNKVSEMWPPINKV